MSRWLAPLGVLLVSSLGCDPAERDLEWWVSFADPGLAADARGMDARILRGDCSSTNVLYEESFDPSASGPTPPVLAPGDYAFAVSARNDACEVIATGCAPVTLPLPDASRVETVLLAFPTTETCGPGATCVDGRCVSTPPDAAVLDAPADACTPTTPGCARVVPSNVIPPDPVDDEITITTSFRFDTTECPTGVLGRTSILSQSDDSTVCVASVGGLTIETDSYITVRGDRPLVILAERTVVIDGVVDAGAEGRVPGAGGFRGGGNDGTRLGAGPFGGGGGEGVEPYEDGGGGGGGMCGAGGNGGVGGTANGGAGGGTLPSTTELVPLHGGSGGGAVRGVGDGGGPVGGGGGGAVQITAQENIVIRGAILVGGGGGEGGAPATSPFNYPAGAGGGSGGAILLEARSVELPGQLGASGGGGGGSAGGDGAVGENGQDGGELDASGGPAGAGMWGAHGGDGGGTRMLDGGVGQSNTDGASSNGGGGGGGAGCIVVRTADAEIPVGASRSNPPPGPAFRALPVRLE